MAVLLSLWRRSAGGFMTAWWGGSLPAGWPALNKPCEVLVVWNDRMSAIRPKRKNGFHDFTLT